MFSPATVMDDIPRLKGDATVIPLSPALQGKTKRNFEMVVARYDESIAWTNEYADFRTVYNKGKNDLECDSIPLENKGHLADTILVHILRNYENLADVTFFCHGAINYRADQQIRDAPDAHQQWSAFITTNPKSLVYIPRDDLFRRDEVIGDCKEKVSDVYTRFFQERYSNTFPWACGLWISVGRDRIRQQPLEFYKKMHEWVIAPENGAEPSQKLYRDRGMYIEKFLLKAFLDKKKDHLTFVGAVKVYALFACLFVYEWLRFYVQIVYNFGRWCSIMIYSIAWTKPIPTGWSKPIHRGWGQFVPSGSVEPAPSGSVEPAPSGSMQHSA